MGKCYIQHYLCFPAFFTTNIWLLDFHTTQKTRYSYFPPFSLSNIIIILFYMLFYIQSSLLYIFLCVHIHSVAFNQELCCGLFSYYKFYLISKMYNQPNKLRCYKYKIQIFNIFLKNC